MEILAAALVIVAIVVLLVWASKRICPRCQCHRIGKFCANCGKKYQIGLDMTEEANANQTPTHSPNQRG